MTVITYEDVAKLLQMEITAYTNPSITDVNAMIAWAQSIVEDKLATKFEEKTITAELTEMDVSKNIWLQNRPVSSITSVEVALVEGTFTDDLAYTTLSAYNEITQTGDYVLFKDEGRIRIINTENITSDIDQEFYDNGYNARDEVLDVAVQTWRSIYFVRTTYKYYAFGGSIGTTVPESIKGVIAKLVAIDTLIAKNKADNQSGIKSFEDGKLRITYGDLQDGELMKLLWDMVQKEWEFIQARYGQSVQVEWI